MQSKGSAVEGRTFWPPPSVKPNKALYGMCCAARSGQGLSSEDLVEVVAKESAGAIQFLQGLGLNLSSIQQLGGHSVSLLPLSPGSWHSSGTSPFNLCREVRKGSP